MILTHPLVLQPLSPGPEHLQTGRRGYYGQETTSHSLGHGKMFMVYQQTFIQNRLTLALQQRVRNRWVAYALPLGAVLMAELTFSVLVSVFPDGPVPVPENATWAPIDTVGAIFDVGALHTLVRALQSGGSEVRIVDLIVILSENTADFAIFAKSHRILTKCSEFV